jgi:hypothetical protein
MAEESVALLQPVVPLPIALYDSNGLLFELYQGGQPTGITTSSGKG